MLIPYGQSLLLAGNVHVGLRILATGRTAPLTSSCPMLMASLPHWAAHERPALIAPMGAAAKCTGKAGAPVVTIPVGKDAAGIPFGVSVLASAGDDARLLAIAAAIEQTIGARQIPQLPRRGISPSVGSHVAALPSGR